MHKLRKTKKKMPEAIHDDALEAQQVIKKLDDNKLVNKTKTKKDPKKTTIRIKTVMKPIWPKIIYDLMLFSDAKTPEDAIQKSADLFRHFMPHMILAGAKTPEELILNLDEENNKLRHESNSLNSRINELYSNPIPIFESKGSSPAVKLYDYQVRNGYQGDFRAFVDELALVKMRNKFPDGWIEVTRY
jgi:hypothetical protein